MRAVTSITTAALFVLLLMAGSAWADTEDPAAASEEPAPVTTEVIVLGSLHGRHYENPNYGVKCLENILVSLEPAAICVELDSTSFHADGRPREGIVIPHAEGQAELAASEALSVPLLPYDREGSEER